MILLNEFNFSNMIHEIEAWGVSVTAFAKMHDNQLDLVIEPATTDIYDVAEIIKDIMFSYSMRVVAIMYNTDEQSFLFRSVLISIYGQN